MIMDKQNSFCFNTDLTATAGAAVVLGDVLDLWGSVNATTTVGAGLIGGPITNLRDFFGAESPDFFGQITTGVTQAANTVTFALTIADNILLTTNPITLFTTGALAAATLIAGYRFRAPTDWSVPLGRQRYMGILYTVTTTNVTAGALTAGLVIDLQSAPNSYL
jgi:hypothetical protein